jgi:hypothetical protein
MTLPTTPEHGTEQPGSELPTPKLESPSPASPSSVDTDAIAKQVADQIRREIRQAQSTKDKELDAIKKGLGIGDLSELEAMGATIPDSAKLEYRLRQIESQRSPASSPDQKPSSPGNGAALTAQEVSEVVQRYKLDANTPEVLEALRGTYRNRDHFNATMADLALRKTNQPQPSAAESAAIQGQPAQAGDRDLQSAYEKKRNEIAQTLRGDAKVKALSDLKVDYRGRGLNI